MATTIYDIAEVCNTSHATVSRALKDHPTVNVDTRKRILRAAKELGYRPQYSARALKGGRTRTISIAVPDLANPFFVEYARAIEQGILEQGYKSAVVEFAWDPDRERSCLEQLLERRYDGAIAFVSRFEPLRDLFDEAWEKRLPCIVPGLPPDAGSAKLDGTSVDIGKGVESAVKHLVDLGHRNITFVASWARQSGAGPDRLRALQSAFAKHDLPYDEASVLFRCTGQQVQDGYDAAKELMARRPETTAILGVNDYLIAGAVRALAELGLRVPEDVSLIGADNTWIARYWPVSLTSIDLKTPEHAQAGVEILFERLATREWREPRRIRVDASLVIRESTGPVRRRPG